MWFVRATDMGRNLLSSTPTLCRHRGANHAIEIVAGTSHSAKGKGKHEHKHDLSHPVAEYPVTARPNRSSGSLARSPASQARPKARFRARLSTTTTMMTAGSW